VTIKRESVVDYVIRLRPMHDEYGVPPAIRLRRGLKYLLRACGLRCVDSREVIEDEPRDDSTGQISS
jgi:hypothetical protein